MAYLLFTILLCSICMALAAGCVGQAKLRQSDPEGLVVPEALAGLLPKRVLPELQVTCDSRAVAGVRGDYEWAIDRSANRLDETWPPPRPSGKLPAAPGEEVLFIVTIPDGSPAEASAKGAISVSVK